MTDDAAAKHERIRQTLALVRPDRLPCGDLAWIEYRPGVYHLGDDEPLPAAGQIGRTRDGKRQVTRDGGVWATDAQDKYRDHTDVLAINLADFPIETVGEPMLCEMRRIQAARWPYAFPSPMQYGTLVTRCTIEFGWEPFLVAAALEPDAFGRIVDHFAAASLAVIKGWCQLADTPLITVHDDIAGTRGLILSPDWYRRYALPWYRRLFDTIHAHGRQALFVSDGDYRAFLPDLLAAGVDGLYVESSSMPPDEFLPLAGRAKLFMIKTNNQIMDFGTPSQIRAELAVLRKLHQEYPGMMMYRGGGRPPAANAEAFRNGYRSLLIYN